MSLSGYRSVKDGRVALGIPPAHPPRKVVTPHQKVPKSALASTGVVVEIGDVLSEIAREYSLARNKLANIGSMIAPRAVPMRSVDDLRALVDHKVALALAELTLDAPGASWDELRASMVTRFGPARLGS